MAEAFLRHHAADRFEALSAGLRPKDAVNPLTIRVLEERSIDTSGLRPKASGEFLGKVSITYAVVVCDKAQSECPRVFPFALRSLYWPFDDPAAAEGNEQEQLDVFRRVRDEIEARIVHWLEKELEPL
jgi:arsenate reductase